MRWWKVIGVASVVGVAATGVVLARSERRRRAYTPEQIRDRLRERHAEALGGTTSDDGRPAAGPDPTEHPA
ncbi:MULTISPECIES: hypothetical protein [unclassified Plantactinospora]|uniref:hypothetical protein n=1 Tax=unclassified Plantactinospora TaxID=2631981 RepID=UPI000D15DA02|nr:MULTISPECIES: hypothetical protein [unclassified Plantactinospora]AVT32146.1 hypothetical protein C6361_24795 [Plantactinospora sp. BC1]AVT40543.1 hypothetical protein C6W10_33400 [Plantactinospora sp. BB1]